MTSFKEGARQARDIAPIGLDPWTFFKLKDEEVEKSEFLRGLEAIESKFPTERDEFQELRYTSLLSNLALQCIRNAAQLDNVVHYDWLLENAINGKNTPLNTIRLHHREPGLGAIEYARLTHEDDDWDGMNYIDEEVEKSIYKGEDVGSVRVDVEPGIKLKQFNDIAQIIQIKGTVASHYGGSSVSKHRRQIAIKMNHPEIDKNLQQEITAAHERHASLLRRIKDPDLRGKEDAAFYEIARPNIGALVLPYLAEIKKPEWMKPHLSSYYVLNAGD